MKKMMKTLAVLSMIGTMAMTMGVTASAIDNKNVNGENVVDGRDDNSSFTVSNTIGSTGITSFKLIKDYDSVNDTSNAPKSSNPAETFTYTIKPYRVWNAGSTYSDNTNHTGTATAIDASNMPMPKWGDVEAVGTGINRQLVITQFVDIGYAKNGEADDKANTPDTGKQEITLPTYDTVGDYWYEVKETIGNTTGVFYGTNDSKTDTPTASNGTHDATYYIHVQVTETKDTAGYASVLVSNVTMHTTAPTGANDAEYNSKSGDNYNQANKVNAIENKYYAGDLVIKKEVTGNAGDKDEYFEVTVTFTKPEGTIVNSDIPFTAFLKTTENNVDTYTSTPCIIKGQQSATTGAYTWIGAGDNTDEKTATVTFYVKDGDSVTFSNIPYGITYRVTEALSSTDTYTHSFANDKSNTTDVIAFDGVNTLIDDSLFGTIHSTFGCTGADGIQGSITDPRDVITITNDKVNSIDIGVILSNAPFIAMLGIAGAASYFVLRRKKRIEE